ncbi:hypothetical protein KR038_004035 [Drosophila bunnanda]|nr:hypothetical protein KR038_004035 [Drosophila bunnanda]
MTPVKWYLLYMTGSLNGDKRYVPRYTQELERRDVVAIRGSKGQKPTRSLPMLSDISLPGMAKKISVCRSTGKKLSKTIKAAKTDPVKSSCSGTRIKQLSIPDSPQMLEFFAEVRKRQLKDYYLRMKAAERCSRTPATFSQWKPSSHNISFPGEKSTKRELQDITKNKICDRYGDYTWL